MAVGEKLDAGVSALVRLALFFVWPVIVAAALGATLFAAFHPELLPALFVNDLTRSQRAVGMRYFAGSIAAVVAVYAAVLWYQSRDHFPIRFDRVRRVHCYLSFLVSGPAIVALTEPKIEKQHPWQAWLYIAIAVLAWWPTFRAFGSREPSTGRRRPLLSERQRDWLSLAAVLGMWVAYATFFTHLSITHHHGFGTRTVDLGLYHNIFFLSSRGEPLACTLIAGGSHASAHIDPILVILSPLYSLWPKAEFLLTLQSVWCGAGAVAAYLIGRDQLGSRLAGIIWAVAYLIHPALHGANMYEFHSLTLLFSPLLFALYFLLAGKLRLYLLMVPLLLLIREDVSLLLCFVGASAIIAGKPGYARAGWITIVVSIAYFAVVKTFIMSSADLFNQGPGSYGFAYYYKEMIPTGWGARDFITTLLTNPAYVAKVVTKLEKLHYLLVIFVPLLFLPAFAGRARIMLVYGFVFIFFASRTAVFSPHFQYSAVLLPIAIALAPVGLRLLREVGPRDRSFTVAVMGCVLVASLLVSWKFGGIVENDSFRGGFSRVHRTLTEAKQEQYQRFLELTSAIEADASVSVTDRVGAHVANRAMVYRLAQGKDTDYYLIDTRDLRGSNRVRLKKLQEAGTLELVGSENTVSLYRALHRSPEPREVE